jgi:Mg2+ and Co2+ transporter CorA
MNIALPLDGSPYAFGFTIALSLSFMVVATLIFRRMDWF